MMMQKKIGVLDANLSANQVWFDFEDYIKENLDLATIEPSEDTQNQLNGQNPKSKRLNEPTGVCNFFLKGHCWKGANCQYRHISLANYNNERMQQQKYSERAVVCKHWLRGLCKKGENCEFLHEYNLTKMPACWFFAKYGECGNSEECVYQHIDPDSRIKECPWYSRGFCKNGPNCKRKHLRKIICKPYLFGFCPDGHKCPNAHPSFDIPSIEPYFQKDVGDVEMKSNISDNRPNAQNHFFSSNKGNMPPHQFQNSRQEEASYVNTHGNPNGNRNSNMNPNSNPNMNTNMNMNFNFGAGANNQNQTMRQPMTQANKQFRSLDQVQCFKCGEMGHYANNCTNKKAQQSQ